jgi:hypothetical protein
MPKKSGNKTAAALKNEKQHHLGEESNSTSRFPFSNCPDHESDL